MSVPCWAATNRVLSSKVSNAFCIQHLLDLVHALGPRALRAVGKAPGGFVRIMLGRGLAAQGE